MCHRGLGRNNDHGLKNKKLSRGECALLASQQAVQLVARPLPQSQLLYRFQSALDLRHRDIEPLALQLCSQNLRLALVERRLHGKQLI
jgi:hypothetical protein